MVQKIISIKLQSERHTHALLVFRQNESRGTLIIVHIGTLLKLAGNLKIRGFFSVMLS